MSQCGDSIMIYNNGIIHLINREPYETNGDVYKRGWFIIKNRKCESNESNESNECRLLSSSLMEIYKNKGMVYDLY
jgi:hypothetical protein